jgi:hypothetical protein
MTDWTTDAADRVESVVATVRDRTVVPAQNATRAVVYGLVAGFLALAAVALLCVAAFRALESYLPGDVWIAYLVIGGIFVLAGAFCWTRRTTKREA